MNVLILTPDRVGSTLLQRLITVYMNAHEYDKPVINLHELTNGIDLYYSDVYNREVLGKPRNGKEWGYYQSLEEVVNNLSTLNKSPLGYMESGLIEIYLMPINTFFACFN
jgi:hypothetical protein